MKTVMISVKTPKELHKKFRQYSFDQEKTMTKLILDFMEEKTKTPKKKKKKLKSK